MSFSSEHWSEERLSHSINLSEQKSYKAPQADNEHPRTAKTVMQMKEHWDCEREWLEQKNDFDTDIN